MSTSFIFLAMLCVGMIVLAAIVAIVYLLAFQDKRFKPKAIHTATTASSKPTGINWGRWFFYIGIALLLAFWSFWISLLFLALMWIMHLNPDKASSYEVTEKEKNTAKRVYTWLFWSPVITVPIFTGMVGNAYGESINTRVFAAILPLIFHTPLLLGFTSKSAFVFRHTQQGILLIAVRAVTASIAASQNDDGLFYFFNGILWLFGTMIARNQVIRGECWLMKRKGETILKPESQTLDDHAVSEELDELLKSMTPKDRQVAYEKSIKAFRAGSPDIRKRAVAVLSALGEVETF